MASAKQIAWRKKFALKYGKKGAKSKYAKNIDELKKGKKLNPKSQKRVDNALGNLYRKSQGRFGVRKKSTPVKKSTGSNRVFRRLEKLKNGEKNAS